MHIRLVTCLLAIVLALPAVARAKFQNWAQQGGGTAIRSLLGSTVRVQQSCPGAQVSVFDAGTTTPATDIYSDITGTVLGYQFTAGSDGRWQFFGDSAEYNIRISGGGCSTYTLEYYGSASGSRQELVYDAGSGPYNMRCDGSTDDADAWDRVIDDASVTGGRILLPSGVCRTSEEWQIPSGSKALIISGSPHNYDGSGGTTLQASAAMRSVLHVESAYHTIEYLEIDANRLASYGLFLNGMTVGRLTMLHVVNALLDGAYLDQQSLKFNDGITVTNCIFGSNGTVYRTTPLAGNYTNQYESTVIGTAATTSGNVTITISGVEATDLTTLPIRKGDFVRVGSTPSSAFYGQIESVTSSAITLQNNSGNRPTATASGLEWAIGVGDGWHETRSADNNVNNFVGCLFKSNGGSGFVMNGLHGDSFVGGQIDYNGFFGLVLGWADNVSNVYTAAWVHPYGEGNVAGDVYAGRASGVQLIAPNLQSTPMIRELPGVTGTVFDSPFLGTGYIYRSLGVGYPQNFAVQIRNNGGTLEGRIVANSVTADVADMAFTVAGASATYAAIPTVSSGVDFTNGLGVLTGFPTVLILGTTNAQNQRSNLGCAVEANSTGTAYTCTAASTLQNVNGTTMQRPAVYLKTLSDVNTGWLAALSAGQYVSVRIFGHIK